MPVSVVVCTSVQFWSTYSLHDGVIHSVFQERRTAIVVLVFVNPQKFLWDSNCGMNEVFRGLLQLKSFHRDVLTHICMLVDLVVRLEFMPLKVARTD